MEPINRSLLKTNAKGILSRNYWPAVCTGLICAAVEAVSSAVYGLGIAGMIFLSPILLGVTLYYVDLSEGKTSRSEVCSQTLLTANTICAASADMRG